MASFVVKPDELETMRQLLVQLSERSRQEPGCLEYGYYQSTTNPQEFSSFEVWQGPEFEAGHWSTEHLQEAFARAAGLLQGEPRIVRYQRLD
jgi:quinol monooxygenase YgiN